MEYVIIAMVVAYGLGSLSPALLLTRRKGVDLRAVGSGNPGATNVMRALGVRWGIVVLIVDMAKGALPTYLVLGLTTWWPQGFPAWSPAVVGLAAVCGHVLPLYHRFRGGKGVATAAGVMLVLAPWATAASVVLFVMVVKLTRVAALGSISAAVSLPLLLGWVERSQMSHSPRFWLACAMAAWVLLGHIPNVRRMIRGQEHRIGSSTPGTPDASSGKVDE